MDVAMVSEAAAESPLPAQDVQAQCGAKKQQVPEEFLPERGCRGEEACEEHSRISDPRLKEGEKTKLLRSNDMIHYRPPLILCRAAMVHTGRHQSWFTKLFFFKWPMAEP